LSLSTYTATGFLTLRRPSIDVEVSGSGFTGNVPGHIRTRHPGERLEIIGARPVVPLDHPLKKSTQLESS
jgi:hypothetical protein